VILLQTSSHFDWLEQIEHRLIRYEKWRDGQLIATELQHLPLHWFGPEEFAMCLRQQGYRDK
jgi:hypothetical protein